MRIYLLLALALMLAAGCRSSQPAETTAAADQTEESPAIAVAAKDEVPASSVQDEPKAAQPKATEPKAAFAEKARVPIREKLKVAFLYVGPVGDVGWSWAHDQGRRKMLEACADIVEKADCEESVPDGPACVPFVEKYAALGYHLVFTTSFDFMDGTLEVAKKYPGTVFMHCSGYKAHSNMGNYFGRIHQTDYLCGLIAGKMTRNGRVGYVAPHPIPEVMRGINSFSLGVFEANPEAKVFIRWVHDWYNPEQERACAEELLSQEDVDFMGQGQDCPNVLLCAQEAGIPGTGYNADMSRYAPDSHMCSPIWDWSKVYIHVVRGVKDGTWRSESIWWGIDKGLVEISPMSEKVPADARELVERRRIELIQGRREVFDGPIRDQSGRLAVPAGRTMTDEELLRMDFLVDGVVGEIPERKGPQHD